MTHPISIGTAILDLGDNRFLSHFTHEIFYKDKVVGHLLYTVYNWGEALDMNAARTWLTRKDDYLNRAKKYLLDDSCTVATISDIISTNGSGPRSCLIIDDVITDEFYMGLGIEMHVLSKFLKGNEMKHDFAMCLNWDFLCDRMGMEDKDKLDKMSSIGLYPLDGDIMIRYLNDEMLNSLIVCEG